MLISLWIYAYSEAVSSAREISRLCELDPAYQWLTGLEPVNYHSLSDFRVGQRATLDQLFTQVLGLLSADGLVTLQRVMQDGTKIKVCAGADTFRREETIRAHLELARDQVEQMGEPSNEESSQRVATARQRAARERQRRLELAQKELEKLRRTKPSADAKSEARVSETDPEARIMKQSDGGFAPSYSVQISTDAAEKIIVGAGVSQSGSDQAQLGAAIDKIQLQAGRRPGQVVVDGGLTTRQAVLEMERRGVDLIGSFGDGATQSATEPEHHGIEPAFRHEAITYQPEKDTYRCPAGNALTHLARVDGVGRTQHQYRARAADCAACRYRPQCCPHAARGRTVVRSEEAAAAPPSGSRCGPKRPSGSTASAGRWRSFPMPGSKPRSACGNSGCEVCSK